MKFLQICLCCLLFIAQISGLHGALGKYQRQDKGLNHLRELITARKEDLSSNVDNVVGKSNAAGSNDVISDDADLLNEYIDKISEAKKRTVKKLGFWR